MGQVQSYKDLEIYQLAHRLAIEVHRVSLILPKFEAYEEASQLRRAAKSIPANIVEGFGRRRYKGEFIRFLTYAHASCNETIEHLEILIETGSLLMEKGKSLLNDYDLLGRKLNRFIQSVIKQHLT
ncbi:MAG: four helix bundle protein [Chloroflexi bacterium]|nr:four helix bundle protein [Chloroflexota bacterium]